MDITDNINDVFKIIKTTSPKTIGIDGIDGVGKTYLAKDIEKMGYKRLSLDNFLKRKSGNYFKFINFELLGKSIKQSSGKLVVEGVLLQKVLRKLPLIIDCFIYITDSVWIYDWLEDYQGKYCGLSIDQIIANTEQETERLNRVLSPESKPYKMDGLRKEIFEYSHEYKPWEYADVVVRNM
jgi:hypothetical protein